MKLAPIVLFVYNRPEHTEKTVNSLKNNVLSDQSELFIFSDGAKNETDRSDVEKIRIYIHNIQGFRNVKIIERECNFGLAKNIKEGVTQIIQEYGRIIVLEDDLLCSKYFLEYMNKALEKYKDFDNIYSITGYSHTNTYEPNTYFDDTYFLNLTSTWSWATWKNKWSIYYDSSEDFYLKLAKNRILKNEFNFNDSYNYFTLVKKHLAKLINSWGIVWYISVFQRNGLTLYPRLSLIQNIGFDGSGVHYNRKKFLNNIVTPFLNNEFTPVLTSCIEEKAEYRIKIAKYIRTQHNFLIKVQNFVSKCF